MGRIAIPSSTASSASNIVKYLKVGTSGGTIYMGEVKVSPSDEDINAMSAKCLTFVAWEDTTFTFTPTSGQILSYSVDGGAYTALPSTGGSVSVSGGQEVSWSGSTTPATGATSGGIGKFSSTGKYNVEGNVMSIMFGSSYKTTTSLSGKNYAFLGLFSGSTTLMSAEYMVLPATTLANYCYGAMFYGCINLTTAPELLATTLANYCYSNMFQGCTSLTTAPELAAETLVTSCYNSMFRGCTSLTTALELPATTLASNCYGNMFQGCTSLTTAPELPATTLAQGCYYYMFYGCTSLVTAPELPATTLASRCYYYMFYGCTSLVTAPELPAETLASECYGYMFSGCTSLNYIKAMFTTTPGTIYTAYWVRGVSATGTFVKNAAATWNVTGSEGIPTGWTVKNDYGNKKCPLTFIARENCTFKFNANMEASASSANTVEYSINEGTTWTTQPSTGVSVTAGNTVMWRGNCTSNTGDLLAKSGIGNFTSTGKFDVEGNPMSLLYNDNFSGQTTTPGSQRSFTRLFSGNTNLVNAENLMIVEPSIKSATHAYMFYGCTSLITAPKLSATTVGTWGYCGMFMGCTSLTEAPDLPALVITRSAYDSMFRNCTSLVKPPKIYATSMDTVSTSTANCASMFAGCTSLTEAPELLVKTLRPSAYNGMFSGCTNLKYVKCLATDISASNCTTSWMTGVASQGTFVKDQTMTGWTRGANGIPTNWKDSDYLTFVALEDDVKFRFNYPIAKESTNKLSYSINDGEWVDNLSNTIYTPYLEKGDKIRWKGTCVPVGNNKGIGNFESTGKYEVEGNVMSLLYGDNYATQTSLAGKDYAFVNLFRENLLETKPQIHNLVNAENLILPATTLSIGCYMDMFVGCLLLERSPKVLPAMTLTKNCYYSMFFRCETMTTAPELPATTLAEDCYYFMFYMCESLATAPELPATTLAKECYGEMFEYCTSLTTAPELPATTLVESCYSFMFQWCPNLNYIKAMFTTTPGEDYTWDWVKGVAATGTFVKNSAATWNVSGNNGVPTGWTVETETP